MVVVISGQVDDWSPEDESRVFVQESEIITNNNGISLGRQGLHIILNKMYNLRKYENIHIFNKTPRLWTAEISSQ